MYRKFIVLLIFACFCCAISKGSMPIRRCTDVIRTPLSVQINDCDSFLCEVLAGSQANMTIQFIAVTNNTENIHAQVVAYVNGNAYPYEMLDDYADVCKHLDSGAHCPLKAGDVATYNFTMPLDNNLLNINVDAEVALVDGNGTCISCFVAAIRVKQHEEHTKE